MAYKLWTNDEYTVLVRMWDTGTVEVCLRDDKGDIWGPPITLQRRMTR